MKKILGIILLGLLLSGNSFADVEEVLKEIKKNKDVVQGFKKVKEFRDSLIEINSTLWKIEDDIRKCEKDKVFDQKFIDLARAVYQTNDKRSEIKLEITSDNRCDNPVTPKPIDKINIKSLSSGILVMLWL